MKKISWSPPNLSDEEKEAAIRVIKSGWLTQGTETEKWEDDICEYIGCKYAVVVNNGTSGLIASLIANGIKPGDEVLVPSFTFIATVNSILSVGAQPVLVDCDPKTFNTDVEFLEKKLSSKTKAIMPVCVAGMPLNLDKLLHFCNENNLKIIEDSAESFGGEYKNKKIGSFGHTSIFSFHIAKQITTVEGGCITTNNPEIAEKLKQIRNHGLRYKPEEQNGKYVYSHFGLNFRSNDVLSAIGRIQLKRINETLAKRNQLVSIYKEKLRNYVEFQEVPNYVTKHPWMFFSILLEKEKREYVNAEMNNRGIATRICWTPVHLQEYHKKNFPDVHHPNSLEIYQRIINPPLGNAHTTDDIEYITGVIVDIMQKTLKR
tara:strand:+ start:621 stop:1742 length:1122 start_codon:yes stop_codon:yes gene_type:complete